MRHLLRMVLAPLALACAAAAAAAATDPAAARAQEIARLEQEKSALFQQLNAAIDDSVRSLRANNDSEAAVGISYIEDLREKMKALNASPAPPAGDRVQAQGAEILDPEEEFRRRARGRGRAGGAEALRQLIVPPIKSADIKIFDGKNIFGDKARNPKRWKQRYDNRVIMQQKLDEWLARREKEKSEIQRVKAAREKEEECPRFGHLKAKRRKKKSRRAGEDGASAGGGGGMGTRADNTKLDGKDARGVPGGSASGKLYPCCRKCCKKSYLGCL